MPSGHPIILPKSNKFNMAAVSVKRSIVKAAFELKSSRGCEKRSKASADRRIVKRPLIKRFDDLLPPLRQKKTRRRMTLVYARALQSVIRAMRQILKDLYGVIRT